ncbi:unnamed protein product [Rhizophagus irregularis]|nr:unnamed protein product [Rhizophagus irregularis]
MERKEQEVFHSKPYSFNIPNNIEDNINNSSNGKNINTKSNSIYKAFGKLEINSDYNNQNDYGKETSVQQTKKHLLNINEKQDNLKTSNDFAIINGCQLLKNKLLRHKIDYIQILHKHIYV